MLGVGRAMLHQEEIRKQGWVYKESALLRQYRKRWLVLTPQRLYTFKKERSYDSPTEVPHSRAALPSDVTSLHSLLPIHLID